MEAHKEEETKDKRSAKSKTAECEKNEASCLDDNINVFSDGSENIVYLHSRRQIDDRFSIHFQRQMLLNRNLISRLGLESELEGHNGCVNCLEWSTSGDLLASGSDDCQIILWDPFSKKKLKTIQSGHQGNIFSVKFLPNSNNNTIVSGAADCKIRVHDANLLETTMVCSCHANRVKRLAVAPNVPFMFWSAAEDGLILQFDLRQPHTCSNTCNNVLVNLIGLIGQPAEAKCVAINPLRPELLAVGANDPFIRLYDRRMLTPTTYKRRQDVHAGSHWTSEAGTRAESQESQTLPPINLPLNCVKYFVAGHLPVKRLDYKRKFRTLACTYLAFSPQGNELLANLGGEQIYLFDILKPRRPISFGVPLNCVKDDHSIHSNGYHLNGTNLSKYQLKFHSWKSKLPDNIDEIRHKANDIFSKGQHTAAIELYNKAITICPNAAVLYGNRAAILMKRGWDGDLYCALRDCYKALEVDPDFFKAHFRLIRCLYELHWNSEAYECFQLFKTKYPEHVETSACVALDRDINKAISNVKSDSKQKSESCSSCNGGSKSKPRDTASDLDDVNERSFNFARSDSTSFVANEEKEWRSRAYDFSERFCGHCNTTTDIKEANFFGSNYIVAGSDDGTFFTWDRKTTNIVRILKGDTSIVNCLQPHPSCCLLATSGIESVVRLWSPRPEDGRREVREVADVQDQAQSNQHRMNMNPLETMLMNMGYRIPYDYEDNDSDRETSVLQCRQS